LTGGATRPPIAGKEITAFFMNLIAGSGIVLSMYKLLEEEMALYYYTIIRINTLQENTTVFPFFFLLKKIRQRNNKNERISSWRCGGDKKPDYYISRMKNLVVHGFFFFPFLWVMMLVVVFCGGGM